MDKYENMSDIETFEAIKKEPKSSHTYTVDECYKAASDFLLMGESHGKNPEDFDQVELERGIKVEMEHVLNANTSEELKKYIAAKIAMDHLSEVPDYYSKLNLEQFEKDHGSKSGEVETTLLEKPKD